jgi:hypothetical protein
LFGFSTGVLALGDFRRSLELLQGVDADAVELSALRETELPRSSVAGSMCVLARRAAELGPGLYLAALSASVSSSD